MNTRVYKIDDRLAMNIPSAVLPKATLQYVEEEEIIPGHPTAVMEWIPLVLGALQRDGRIPMFLPPTLMGRLNLDVTKPIRVRLYGEPGRWFTSHLWHRPLRDRVHIPRGTVRKLKLRPHTHWFVYLSGTTLPERRIRMVPQMTRKVIVQHINKTYHPERVGVDSWRWTIPETISCYVVLTTAIDTGITPVAQCHLEKEIIYVDFTIPTHVARLVSEKVGTAWRNMAVRNYTASPTYEIEYPFLCEIRATYLSNCPLEFYQFDEKKYYKLKQALETTVYNMMNYFFPSAELEMEYSSISYADHIDKIETTENMIFLPTRYPKSKYPKFKFPIPDITSPGAGEDLDNIGDIDRIYPFYKCIKYIRVINEDVYKGKKKAYIYKDDGVEAIIMRYEEQRAQQDIDARVWIDDNGFVWRVYK